MNTNVNVSEFQLPNDFINKMKNLLGEEWDAFFESYEKSRHQSLRFNPLKKGWEERSYETLLGNLQIEEIQQVPWTENGFYYKEENHPGKHPYHEAGVYYIQEPSAMAPAALLPLMPGMRVLDLCAAPGGKSTQMAGKLHQQGLLVSNEIHPARCKILSQNMERLGVRNTIVTNEDSATLAEHFPCYFHGIMVDAPCSGEGMFRKNPEAIREWSKEQVEVCARRQLEILENASRMLAKGGVMAYSTCTFSPEENEQVITAFLREHPDFFVEEIRAPWFSQGKEEWAKEITWKEFVEPVEAAGITQTFRLWPHKLEGEGHFLAILRKKGTLEMNEEVTFYYNKKKTKKSVLDKQQLAQLTEFVNTTLREEMAQWIINGELLMFGENLYRLPEEAPSLRGIKTLRPGLHVGTFKKNRFEPAHALAMALGEQEVKLAVSVSYEDAKAAAYLRGESFMISEEEIIVAQEKKGWCLVCVDGFSMGWGKLNGVQVKNHYPKGLRKAY